MTRFVMRCLGVITVSQKGGTACSAAVQVVAGSLIMITLPVGCVCFFFCGYDMLSSRVSGSAAVFRATIRVLCSGVYKKGYDVCSCLFIALR